MKIPWSPRRRMLRFRRVVSHRRRHSFRRLRPSASHRIVTCRLARRFSVDSRSPRRRRRFYRRHRLLRHSYRHFHVSLDRRGSVASVVEVSSVDDGWRGDAISDAMSDATLCRRRSVLFSFCFATPSFVGSRSDPCVVGVSRRGVDGALRFVGRRRGLILVVVAGFVKFLRVSSGGWMSSSVVVFRRNEIVVVSPVKLAHWFTVIR